MHTQNQYAKKSIVLLCLFAIHIACGQTQTDTLNRFNQKHHKQGLWKFYLNNDFRFCDEGSARFYAFSKFEDGREIDGYTEPGRREPCIYKPYTDTSGIKYPQLLNGELFIYNVVKDKKYLSYYENYKNGRISVIKQMNLDKNDSAYALEVIYFDSLYKQQPNSFLFYSQDEGIALYKQYVGYKKDYSERMFFVKHRNFKSIYRPIIGVTGSLQYFKPSDSIFISRNFLELGISKKFVRGFYADTTGRKYYDNLIAHHAVNFSLLGSFRNGSTCFGQKLTYSYLLFLLRAEAGLINYTDFKRDETWAMGGLGFSAFGFVNCMFQFSAPLTKTTADKKVGVNVSVIFN